ncbi:hypothetical protein OXX69_005905 [Metschnikowia pulcherrima]
MAWFGTDPVAELDAKIEEATSESIPNGEMDMAVAMEITDVIRSKKVPPKQAMRSLKKRLTKVYANPNTLAAVLKLADVCVKNGGSHFLAEINSKEFIDYLVEYIFKVHYDVKNYKVYSSEAKNAIGMQILKIVKEWSSFFPDTQGSFVSRTYANLTNQGYEFPAVDTAFAGTARNFVDTATPPDWIDGPECMICYNPFSVMNRKHHCRACGGVFCQTHSGHNIPLVSLGILQPVRVCDDCFQIHKGARKEPSAPEGGRAKTISAPADDEDEQLKRAIELSLQDTGVPVAFAAERPPSPPPSHVTQDDEDDEQLKAAIAASLAEYKQTHAPKPTSVVQEPAHLQPQPEPESEFYSNIMPFDANAYSNEQPQIDTQASAGGYNPFVQQTASMQNFHSPQNVSQIQRQDTHPSGAPPVSRPPVQDLTAQEEEDINLFVQLMGGIKSDPVKQANILYDQNLGELHGKVVRLKPKLNRALRSSIEKYETFLEMNNKINSITRLYDQFLDHKLNQAYNKHAVTSPGSTYTPMEQNVTGQPKQQFFMDRSNTSEVFARPAGSVLASPQTTGVQQVRYQQTAPQELPYQPTAPQFSSYQASTSHGVAPERTGPHRVGHQPTGVDSVINQATGSNSQRDSYLYQPHESYGSAPEPEYEVERRVSEHDQTHRTSVSARRRRSSAPYPEEPEVDFQGDVDYEHNGRADYRDVQNSISEEQVENAESYRDQGLPQYPQVPSSPPSDGLSDAESVKSRYPALEDEFSENTENPVAGGPREHASARFPSLNDLNLPDLNVEPLAELKKSTTNESKKFRAEPEPLIEL